MPTSTLLTHTRHNLHYIHVHVCVVLATRAHTQMISGIKGLQEILLLAKLTNRTLVAPLTGSPSAKAFFHMSPGMETGSTAAPASSFSEVFETTRLSAAIGVRILPLADYNLMRRCGLWASETVRSSRMCLACTYGGAQNGKEGQTCKNAELTCGYDRTGRQPWPGTARAAAMGLRARQTCGPMYNTHKWLPLTAGPEERVTVPCVHKRTGGQSDRHFAAAFPGNATSMNTPAGPALRFSGPSDAAQSFLERNHLSSSGFLGVHWRYMHAMCPVGSGVGSRGCEQGPWAVAVLLQQQQFVPRVRAVEASAAAAPSQHASAVAQGPCR